MASMGLRGPIALTDAEKRRRGTYRPGRARPSAAEAFRVEAPPRPYDLPEDAAAIWDAIVPLLLERGTLAAVDGGALETYCRESSRWKALQAEAAKRPFIETPYGPKANPASDEARKLHRDVLQPRRVALG